jgi:predicted adenylyl cyclase CyaB
MPRNLEVKLKIDNLSRIREISLALGAEKHALLKQKDIYYNTDKGLLKLRIMPEFSEFIFYNRNEREGERWSDYNLLKISNQEKPEEFFNLIFDTVAIVEKEREVLLYDNTRIHLDKVKNLGEFLELETVVTSTLDDAKTRFNFLVDKLNLDLNNQIKKSYKNLVMENDSK